MTTFFKIVFFLFMLMLFVSCSNRMMQFGYAHDKGKEPAQSLMRLAGYWDAPKSSVDALALSLSYQNGTFTHGLTFGISNEFETCHGLMLGILYNKCNDYSNGSYGAMLGLLNEGCHYGLQCGVLINSAQGGGVQVGMINALAPHMMPGNFRGLQVEIYNNADPKEGRLVQLDVVNQCPDKRSCLQIGLLNDNGFLWLPILNFNFKRTVSLLYESMTDKELILKIYNDLLAFQKRHQTDDYSGLIETFRKYASEETKPLDVLRGEKTIHVKYRIETETNRSIHCFYDIEYESDSIKSITFSYVPQIKQAAIPPIERSFE